MTQPKHVRAIALILCLILCLIILPACKQKSDPLASLGFSSLKIDRKGERVTASIRLDARTLQKHAGEWIYLYELQPGETTETAKGILPIASAKISSSVDLSFDLLDGERTRLFSTFVVGFEDGSVLSHDGHAIENPEILASAQAPFLWTGSPKGLLADNTADAAALHTSHVAYELSLSLLLSGADPHSFGGVTYTYNESALLPLDRALSAAAEGGMQVSLRFLIDVSTDEKTLSALFSLLADRYDGDSGILSAIYLHHADLTSDAVSDSTLTEQIAAIARMANHALRSHISNGRVYVHSDLSLNDTHTFFSDLTAAIARGGEFDWGLSVIAETPLPSSETAAGDDAVTGASLSELEDLISSRRGARWLSVDLVPIQSLDPDLQAAAYAYHYLAAAQAKPSAIFYLSHFDSSDGYDQNGLYDADGNARPLASVYASIDSGLSESDLALCRTAWGAAWTAALEAIRSVKRVSGSAGIGMGGMGERALFDFRENSTHGFTEVAALSDVTLRNSGAQGAPVLYLWADPVQSGASGIRKVLPSGSELKNALSLSVHFLAQAADSGSGTARLTLVGSAPNGTKLIYDSTVEVACGSWQTATFQISQFILDADLSKPCVLTFTVEPDIGQTEPYPIWVGSVLVRTPEAQSFDLTPMLLILGGVVIGCLGVLLIYRHSVTRAEAKRRQRARAHRRGSRRE